MKINSNSIRKMIAIHLFLVLLFPLLWSVCGVPWSAVYIFDMLACVEFAWTFRNVPSVFDRVRCSKMIPYLVILVLYFLFTQMINLVSPVICILAYRRVFRFFLFYLACAVLLTENGINKILDVMMKMQTVNFLLTVYQYSVMGISQDYLGGIFGTAKGANGYSNVFLCVICAYIVVKYLLKQIKLMPLVWIIGSSLLIAALAELKIFFIELIVIVLMAVVLSNPSARTIKVIVFSAAGFAVALPIFSRLFPEHMAILLDWTLFTRYTTEAVAGYNIGRLNAFSEINELFFKDSFFKNLFGFGFGNCESGSAFYRRYAHYNYTWFAHQVSFLETGYVGVALYLFFFVLVFSHAAKSKKANPENGHYYMLAQIVCILCVIWFVYNQSLRIEVAYVIFFLLAVPVAVRKDWEKKDNR